MDNPRQLFRLAPEATPVRAFRISLVHPNSGERFTIRERFLEPRPEYAKTIEPKDHAGGIPLASAIKRFNARNNQADGHKQPPLTENEVVAAIIHQQTKRDEADVSDAPSKSFSRSQKHAIFQKELRSK